MKLERCHYSSQAAFQDDLCNMASYGTPWLSEFTLQLQFGSHAQLCFHVPNVTPDELAGEPSCLDS